MADATIQNFDGAMWGASGPGPNDATIQNFDPSMWGIPTGIRLGSVPVTAISFGALDVTEVYYGSTLIWPIASSPTFIGPNVTTVILTENVAVPDPTPDPAMDTRFTGTTTYALHPDSGPLPTGVTVDPATGNLVGTPLETGTFTNISVRGT